ncbi:MULTISPECIES: hypothetical protein [Petrimonas]|jgi:uncharacterized coiled-coil DUF342 family protein|uniref:Uncharacterized protein n=1 Tax=Petrimonas mucosa TaxID=1642646 RepID=A0A1G4G4F3_9BACT|nr:MULTISPECIES: hypothetical protein [Petrimonas]MDD3561037.1 hypothetical protein [Petrimonas mucosa]SCM55619.1 putative protein {ECO:0000313/EMBL:CEA14593,1} [Petrimonas mucosa]SFU53119.1 hypothetical protein SAMN05216364_102119 [Porphyromonadaceae bacterium KHP3R9]HHT29445.1 hypothetical protein [Petrimonas mucosa]
MIKQEFRQRAQEILDQLEEKIDEMKQGISNIAEEARDEYAEQLEKLKSLRDELAEKLTTFDDIAESRWDVVRESAISFFSKVSEAWKEDFERVKQAFRKQE